MCMRGYVCAVSGGGVCVVCDCLGDVRCVCVRVCVCVCVHGVYVCACRVSLFKKGVGGGQICSVAP